MLNALVSDLTCMTEVKGRLIALIHELQNVQAKMIDLNLFERGVENMLELLRRVVIALVRRLNASIEGCTKLAAQAEETVKGDRLTIVAISKINPSESYRVASVTRR